MTFGYHDDSDSNPAKDARDAVVAQIDKILCGLETVVVDGVSSTQLISLLDAIRASLPQFRTNLDGLTRLLSALEDVDKKLSGLRQMTRLPSSARLDLTRSVLEEIPLDLDDALIPIIYGHELGELAPVKQEENLDDVAQLQIFVPHWPSRPSTPSEGSPTRIGADASGRRARSIPPSTEETETDFSRKSSAFLQAVLQLAEGGATVFTVEDLCDKIRAAPELGDIPIGELFRREIPTGLQHEFIVIKSIPVAGRSVWIRVDRAAKGYRRWQIRTRYPAHDTARMSRGDEGHQRIVGKSRLRAHVRFVQEDTVPRFLTLADLIMIMHEESSEYRLLSENCYFFTSVIQEILTEHYRGHLVSGTLGHRALGAEVRRKVRQRFRQSETEIPSQTTHEPPTQLTSTTFDPGKLWNMVRSLRGVVRLISRRAGTEGVEA